MSRTPPFELRLARLPPGHEQPYREEDWRDALVVVGRGEVELECAGGDRARFRRGDLLWLTGLRVHVLRNRGGGPALLVAVLRPHCTGD